MVETAEFLADMPMGDFYERCKTLNVTELDAIIRQFNIMQGDLSLAGGYRFKEMADRIANKEDILFDEFKEYTQQMSGIGAVIKSLDEKITIAKLFHYLLTPDCFLSEKERLEREQLN